VHSLTIQLCDRLCKLKYILHSYNRYSNIKGTLI
jgi:hypothetical protein